MSTLPDNWPEVWAARKAEAQRKTHVHLCGIPYARLPYGKEEVQGGETCRDCGVGRGQLHVPTCCIERCPICLGQANGCGCPDDDDEEEVEA
jgi:hypothetical protein